MEQWLRDSETGGSHHAPHEPMEEDGVGWDQHYARLCRPEARLVCDGEYLTATERGHRTMFYDPTLGLRTPLRSRIPGRADQGGGEGSAFQAYEARALKPGEPSRVPPVGPRVVPTVGKERAPNSAAWQARGDAERECQACPSEASSRMSCSSSKLLGLIRKALNEPNLRVAGQEDPNQQTGNESHQAEQAKATVTQAPGLAKPGAGGVVDPPSEGRTSTTSPWVNSVLQKPVGVLSISHEAPPSVVTPMAGMATLKASAGMKQKKLKGFSGGKDQSWEIYRTHLQIVRQVNAWDDATTLAQFCSELTGVALQFYSSLAPDEGQSLDKVAAAMSQRFGTMTSSESVRSRLEGYKQKTEQSIEDVSQAIRSLAYSAFSGYPQETRESEAVRYFMKALSSREVVQALIQASPPIKTMERATEMAIQAREMAQSFLGRTKAIPVRRLEGDTDTESFSEYEEESLDLQTLSSEDIVEGVRALITPGGRYRGRPPPTGYRRPGRTDDQPTRGVCWMCGDSRHFAQECDYRPTNWPEWLKADVKSKAKGQAVGARPAACTAVAQPPQQGAHPPPAQQVVSAQQAPVAVQQPAVPALAPPVQRPVAFQPPGQLAPAANPGGAELPALRLLSDIVSNLIVPQSVGNQTGTGAKSQPGQPGTGKGKKGKRGRKQASKTDQGTGSEAGKAGVQITPQSNQQEKEPGN